MRYLKTYEQKNDTLEIGDYVLIKDRYGDLDDPVIDKIINFVESHVGQFILMLDKEDENTIGDDIYVIHFINVPEDLQKYFKSNTRVVARNEIVKWSKNKEDIEIYIDANTYNL